MCGDPEGGRLHPCRHLLELDMFLERLDDPRGRWSRAFFQHEMASSSILLHAYIISQSAALPMSDGGVLLRVASVVWNCRAPSLRTAVYDGDHLHRIAAKCTSLHDGDVDLDPS